MANANDLRRGQRVTVKLPRHDKPREAVILKVPPFTEQLSGNEQRITDQALIQYPGTSLDGGRMFADISELVSLDAIEVK